MSDDLMADVAFTLSPTGRERREDREIRYAEEIHRLRHEMRRVIGEREEARTQAYELLVALKQIVERSPPAEYEQIARAAVAKAEGAQS
jgi:hypothetical protein